MYVTATAEVAHTPGSRATAPKLTEHGVSLMETMTMLANSMLDYLDVPNWNIQVHINDPEPSRNASRSPRDYLKPNA